MPMDNRADFHKRLASLDKKPAVGGRAKRADRVGVYDQEEEKRRKGQRVPWKRLILTILVGIVGLIGVKAFTVHKMGEDAYQARLAELRDGDSWEPYAAIIISRDPLMMLFERLLFSNSSVRDMQSDPETLSVPTTENAPEPSSEAS